MKDKDLGGEGTYLFNNLHFLVKSWHFLKRKKADFGEHWGVRRRLHVMLVLKVRAFFHEPSAKVNFCSVSAERC